ncbi:hypothetical protein RUM44_001768 [Polyplax serrata]|uniref:Uncharacterized protein n=1 Tax=Polyplax serrata TaxID=468196 RepID=A0ABR1AL07_POLSC
MTCHKLVLVALFLVRCSHQTRAQDETVEFKPIDNAAKSFADEILNDALRDDHREETRSDKSMNELVRHLRSLLNEYDNFNLSKGIQLKRIGGARRSLGRENERESLVEDLLTYGENHVVSIQLYDLVEDVSRRVKEGTEALDVSERCEYRVSGWVPTVASVGEPFPCWCRPLVTMFPSSSFSFVRHVI